MRHIKVPYENLNICANKRTATLCVCMILSMGCKYWSEPFKLSYFDRLWRWLLNTKFLFSLYFLIKCSVYTCTYMAGIECKPRLHCFPSKGFAGKSLNP